MRPALRKDVEALLNERSAILHILKRIYRGKLDVVKIRIHGNYELQKILLTGKDIAIQDFGGNVARPFSERRLKRSPVRDLATMICSIHYAAYEGFYASYQVQKTELALLLPFAEQWAHYMSGFFIKAYTETVQDSAFLPKHKEDLTMLLQTFVLERALRYLNAAVNNDMAYAVVPLRIIQAVLKEANLYNHSPHEMNIN
jgi:maltose alpha-D-glucosyltransferase/alpha-amylase